MATLNMAYSITSGALEADQAALAVVSNNVSNANTTGYTREVATFEENDPITLQQGLVGDGTTMTGGVSQRDPVLEEDLQQQNQAASATDSRLSALDDVQEIFDQTTTSTSDSTSTSSSTTGGIGDDMTSFFDALSSLESDPSSTTLRQSVLSSADTLANDFQNAASQLSAQQSSIDQESVSIVQQVNSLTGAIASLNQQIQSTSPNSDAGTLEDEREEDIQQLSSLIGIHQVTTEDNGLSITTSSGALLVSEGSSYALTTGSSDGVTHIYDSEGNDLTTDLASGGGQLGGLLEVRDQDIPEISTALDTLAYDFGTEVNTVNEAGDDVNGDAGTAIFTLPTSSTGAASTISVAMTDPDKIAAAATGEGSSDDTNLLDMVNLQNQTIVDGSTPTDYYSAMISTLGTMVSDATVNNTAQQDSLTQLQTQVSSLSSVNLNDEASSLETFEQSYEAASKLFSTLDSVMLSALNLGVETAYSS
ncbi:flagellar hook-associated protein FlgK [Silvibacterium dinghuense]|uniref:Flagellar hook-associated protein 1 n=1 Tax=Silvibacterium dinghuense TaxID=1560006 RepID=A0A4Q1SET6_9BACT|nr:flagellar hook-associated protein FlgK [Silvibacterium dinghuense]RXS95647.1 flagellar hook-associated protein FlgK [Silvibacterium dinghuense]GGH14667.1 flagellar hook-associated protein 1 [Silvibacterium dinghuense]